MIPGPANEFQKRGLLARASCIDTYIYGKYRYMYTHVFYTYMNVRVYVCDPHLQMCIHKYIL